MSALLYIWRSTHLEEVRALAAIDRACAASVELDDAVATRAIRAADARRADEARKVEIGGEVGGDGGLAGGGSSGVDVGEERGGLEVSGTLGGGFTCG